MKLDAWMIQERLTNAALGARINKSATAVFRYRSGLRDPDAAAKIAIYRESRGSVTPNDFYDLPPLEIGEAA